MRKDGKIFNILEESLNFYYNEGLIEKKVKPATIVDNIYLIKSMEKLNEIPLH